MGGSKSTESEGVAKNLYTLFCSLTKCSLAKEENLLIQSIPTSSILQEFNTLFHWQTNGLFEGYNQALQRSILKMVEENNMSGTAIRILLFLPIKPVNKLQPSSLHSLFYMVMNLGFLLIGFIRYYN